MKLLKTTALKEYKITWKKTSPMSQARTYKDIDKCKHLGQDLKVLDPNVPDNLDWINENLHRYFGSRERFSQKEGWLRIAVSPQIPGTATRH